MYNEKDLFKGEVKGIKRRKYEWTILSSRLKESYYRDILYKDLD